MNLVCKTNKIPLLCAFYTLLAAGTASAQQDDSQPVAEPPAAPLPPAPVQQDVAPVARPEAVATPAAAAEATPAEQPAEVYPVPMPSPAVSAAPAVAELQAPAEDSVTPFNYTGSFFSRYELREGYAEQGLTHPRLHREGDYIVYRARLGIATNPVSIGETSTVQAVFVPQASGTHSTQGSPVTIGDTYDLGVYEAYVGLQGERLRLDVGRFAMNYGDALVIGNLDWNEAARAFQGARVRYASPKNYSIDFFGTLISEGRATTGEIGDGDVYFYGAYASLGGLVGEMDLDLYLLGQSAIGSEVDVADPTDPMAMADPQELEGATEMTLGARVKQKIATIDYRAEAGLQFGSVQGTPGGDSRSKFAYHVDGEIGVAPAPGLRLALGGLVASGDDPTTDDKQEAWNQLYPTAHKFLGLSDVFGARTNALSANAKVSYKAADSLIVKLDAHLLSRMEENATGESFVGSEFDLNVISPLGKGAVVRAMYAAFLPNTDYWQADSSVHFLEVQFGYNFR